ncbi:MAG: hypothetical protein FJZ00_05105 [Candidatus Sericytochromatia bacterium]|uniref:ATP-grasp domain-containing protein n=1 Tax=Candidatus Tanganyikabacteria bacterium TaxID=2961651 RepID=A0A938BKR8_9BACT|nr:hypothetical protein [Candidatus Tanganyikabacteria bacterium]
MASLLIHDLVVEAASGLGVRVEHLGELAFTLRLTYPGGRTKILFKQHFPVDRACVADAARVKAWMMHFLRAGGLCVPEGDFFFEDAWAARRGIPKNTQAASECAERLGYPVVIKPSCQSLGTGVHLVPSAAYFADRVREVVAIDPMFLIQRLALGTEYRVVVLDEEVRLAYKKAPFRIHGDGERTCGELIAARFAEVAAAGRQVAVRPDDSRFDSFLASQGLDRLSVLSEGQACQVGLTAGYNAGGELSEGWDTLGTRLRAVACAAVRLCGLRFGGLDMVVANAADPERSPYVILDVNPSPIMDGYARTGPEAQARVANLVRDLLVAMRPEG